MTRIFHISFLIKISKLMILANMLLACAERDRVMLRVRN